MKEEDKQTQTEVGYTDRIGGRLQVCYKCDEYTPNGRDWGSCGKVQEAVWCYAHCRLWVMTGGKGARA